MADMTYHLPARCPDGQDRVLHCASLVHDRLPWTGYVYAHGKRVYGEVKYRVTVGYWPFEPFGKWADLVRPKRQRGG